MRYPWFRRAIFFAIIWMILTEGKLEKIGLGGLVILAALALDYRLHSGLQIRPWRLREVLRFLPFFLLASIRGGVDVALRALAPRMRLNPGIVPVDIRLREPGSRAFHAMVVGLLPGTVCAEIESEALQVHFLDRDTGGTAIPKRLEAEVANLYRVSGPGQSDVSSSVSGR